MARKVYRCNNENCLTVQKTQFTNEDHTCSDCGEMMELDKVASMKGVSMDRVPDGYESNELQRIRNSRDGQIAEANYLAGEGNTAY
jgi:transcription initiation factor IIE alpha subunit